MPQTLREAPDCGQCPYRKHCLFDLLETKDAKRAWKNLRRARSYKAGEEIFGEGMMPSGLFVVCKGLVKIFKSSGTGQQLTTRLESPGDLLGHVSLLAGDGAYTAAAAPLDTAVVSMIDTRSFLNFLKRFPHAALALLRELARDVRRGENKARDIAFKPARGRLADTLLRMMKPSATYPLVAGIKRRDLAEMAGLTVETTVRLLKDFEAGDILRKSAKDLLIVGEEQLRQIAANV